MPVYNLKDRKQNYKIPDNVTNKLNNFSFPWFNEYANTIAELNRFNEYEPDFVTQGLNYLFQRYEND